MTDMNNFEDFFNEDPWADIEEPIYPLGRKLFVRDDRFWVSINQKSELVFFVQEDGAYDIKEPKQLKDLVFNVEKDQKYTRLVYVLTDDLLKDKFSTIVKHVAYNSSSLTGQKFLEEVTKEIISWADFLRPSRRGLTHAELIGLWGELYILTNILPDIFSIQDSVRFWIGPEGKKQDFTVHKLAIETKTTLSGDGDIIKISSIEQLHKITEELYLMHVFINLSESENGKSLRDMYKDILIKTNDDTQLKNHFEVKISSIYGKATEDQLDEKFNFISFDLYQVTDEFPKITSEVVSSSIIKAKYNINTASLLSFKVEKELKDLLNE